MESINPTAPNGECIRVLYEDGDRADYTQETLDQLVANASIHPSIHSTAVPSLLLLLVAPIVCSWQLALARAVFAA